MADATVLPPALRKSRTDLAVTGFLTRYSGNTLAAYQMDLKVLLDWCVEHQLDPLEDVTRPHLELFSRYLSVDRGNNDASVHRRMSTIRCFYRIAVADELIRKSPAEHVRLPKLYRDESRTLGLDRVELGGLIATARASTPSDAALITLMGMLGLRVSEACSVRIENMQGYERGHRTLRLVGKGGKPATIPLPVPVARVLDAAAGDRTSGPLLLRRDGTPMDRRAAARATVRLAKRTGIKKKISPHSLRHSFVTACLDAGVPLRDVQIAARHSDPRMTARYDRARGNLDRSAVYIVAGFLAGAA